MMEAACEGIRNIIWDEENRIQGIKDNGSFHHYVYDAAGERVLKGQSSGQQIFVSGQRLPAGALAQAVESWQRTDGQLYRLRKPLHRVTKWWLYQALLY